MTEKRWKILIVDDDAAVSRILIRVFQRAGFEVLTAPNGKLALGLVAENQFDAMISDIQMPYMDGRELVRHLAGKGPYLPGCTFVVTSRSEDCERRWVNEHPGVRLVEKPVSPKQMLRLVTERLSESESDESSDENRGAA